MNNGQFMRGARPTPRHKLLAAQPFRTHLAPPPQFAIVPKKLSYWLNNQYGDCVTAEEAFKCACDNPEDFIPDDVVQKWASAHGVLNGADLKEVCDAMAQGGFVVGQNEYRDGAATGVDFSIEAVLQAAIATGPVKIGIDANALPSGAGNQSGWTAFGGGHFPNTDHCVSLCGYGPVPWLAQQLGVQPPANAPANGYLLFTWSTIGIVDHPWLMGTCTEAWVRTPSTVIVGPEPQPQPPGPPAPPVPPDIIPWVFRPDMLSLGLTDPQKLAYAQGILAQIEALSLQTVLPRVSLAQIYTLSVQAVTQLSLPSTP